MNNFMSKIKSLDYKQFALQHGEKIGMVAVGLIVLASLALTNWAAEYKGDPAGMIDQADKVERQLKGNLWTDEKKKDFLPYLTAEGELAKVTEKLDVSTYDWPIDPSHKLYKSSQPADEADWLPVVGLQPHYSQMPMGVFAPPPSEPADDAKAKPAKGDKKKAKSEELTIPATPPMGVGAGGGAMSSSAGAAERARGVRFNVLVGVVEVLRQHKLLMQKLHVESLTQAASRLKYVGFRVQRQRALPGDKPWTGPWRDLNTDASMDVLGEAADFDQELVHIKFTNVEFTSPLPHRLDEDWDPNIVVHRRIPTLTEDEQEAERIKNEAAHKTLEGSEDADDSEPGKRGGFSRVQKDANRMRQRASSTDEGRNSMRDYEASARKDSGGMGMGGASPSRPNATGMGNNKMAGAGGMGNMGGPGGAAASEAGADLLLFRYFDFDVEPGECYRYRVQLIVRNPSFQQSYVSAPAVAEGEFRDTPWSAPSPPVVVASDIDYALTRVPVLKSGRHDGAELNIVQFDTNLGTFIMDTLTVLFGSTVGGPKMSLHLDVAAETFKEENVTFSSRDVLLDSAAAPNLKNAANAVADLNLSDAKELKKLTSEGALDMAVTLNRFGEIVELDADSKGEIEDAKKEVETQREPYDSIKVTDRELRRRAKEATENALDEKVNDRKGAGKDKKVGKKKKKKTSSKGSNPLKGGSSSAPGGMTMPQGYGGK
jgi:hypothetical protein